MNHEKKGGGAITEHKPKTTMEKKRESTISSKRKPKQRSEKKRNRTLDALPLRKEGKE